MKTISIRQPWAWCIVQGSKDVENRTWTTSYRGPLLIHAGLRIDVDYMDAFYQAVHEDEQIVGDPVIHTGGIIGIVDLVDIVTISDSEWFNGPYGWVLANARPLEFYPCKGRLGLFDIDYPHRLDNETQESWLYRPDV